MSLNHRPHPHVTRMSMVSIPTQRPVSTSTSSVNDSSSCPSLPQLNFTPMLHSISLDGTPNSISAHHSPSTLKDTCDRFVSLSLDGDSSSSSPSSVPSSSPIPPYPRTPTTLSSSPSFPISPNPTSTPSHRVSVLSSWLNTTSHTAPSTVIPSSLTTDSSNTTRTPPPASPNPISSPSILSPSISQRFISRTRLATLPPKSPAEDAKHLAQYANMVANAERARKKLERSRLKKATKREQAAAANLKYWTDTVLPQWDNIRYSDNLAKRWVRDGIPPRLRSIVWLKAIGNALHITIDVFNVCCNRAQIALTSRRLSPPNTNSSTDNCESDTSNVTELLTTSTATDNPNINIVLMGREDTLPIIHADIDRTFPHLGLFQSPTGPMSQPLSQVLKAFTVYRADIGYVQGLSYLAGVLLINMDAVSAFISLCNMFRHPLGVLPVMYRLDMTHVRSYFSVFQYLLNLACPDLNKHFIDIGIRPEFYLYEWFLSMFSKPLPLDTTHRVWDLWFLSGDGALFRVAVAILKYFESRLLGLPFEECLQDLLRLPGRIGNEYDDDEFWSIVTQLDLFRDVYRAACRKHGIEPPE